MDHAHGVADDDVAGGFLDDGQGLQNRHTAADERAQSAGEARDGHFAHDGAEDRDDEFKLSQSLRPNFKADEDIENDDNRKNFQQGPHDMVFDGGADVEDETGEAGQLSAAAKGAFKNLPELGMTITIKTPMMGCATTRTAQG